MNKVCFFGIHDPNYARNRVLASGFRHNGYEVTDCCVDPKVYLGMGKYFQLYKEFKKLKGENFDLVLIAFPGQTVVWLARILFGKKIIFDAFLSLYDSNVFDRKIYSKFSPRAWKDYFMDWNSCFFADKVLLDTDEHIKYFCETFHFTKDKFISVPIGADESIFYPREVKGGSSTFNVHFHGTFIPLQGVEYVVEAAGVLRDENIHFTLVGSGQDFCFIKDKVKSSGLESRFSFVGKVPMEKIPDYVALADVCLGIFGKTEKTKRVIPNKVYECIAMRKPVITAKSDAILQFFRDGEDIIMCKTSDGKDLADKLMILKSDKNLRVKISEGGYNLFKNNFTSTIIVKNLLTCL